MYQAKDVLKTSIDTYFHKNWINRTKKNPYFIKVVNIQINPKYTHPDIYFSKNKIVNKVVRIRNVYKINPTKQKT